MSEELDVAIGKIGNNYLFYGVVEHDYERSSCMGHCDDYCRCTVITQTNVSDYKPHALASFISNEIENPYLVYVIDRIILNSEFTSDDFELNVSGGYYGEEINGLTFKKAKFLEESLESLQDLSDVELVKKSLISEYGYLLPEIESMTKVSIEDIDLSAIMQNNDYRKKVKPEAKYYGESFNLPRGIFIKSGDSHFRLIDGYHRVATARFLDMKSIKGIVLK